MQTQTDTDHGPSPNPVQKKKKKEKESKEKPKEPKNESSYRTHPDILNSRAPITAQVHTKSHDPSYLPQPQTAAVLAFGLILFIYLWSRLRIKFDAHGTTLSLTQSQFLNSQHYGVTPGCFRSGSKVLFILREGNWCR